jgi:exonuclease SbcC
MIKLNSLYVDGFKNLKNCRLNFPPEGNILITGRNESGKSSLFESIFFSLTSKLLVRKNRGYIDAIAHDKNAAEIDLIFQKNNIPARIRKKIYKKGEGTTVDIEFWKDYQDGSEAPIEGKTTEVDPQIEDFLGFDDQILLNSAFVQQKGLEGFMSESRQERIDILNKLLNLEKIPEIRENFKSELKEKEVIEEYLKNKYIIHKNKRQIQKIEDDVRRFDELGSKYDKIKKHIKQINVRISEHEKFLNDSKKAEKRISRLNEKKEKTKKELEEINQYKKKIAKFEKIKNSVKNLKKDKEKTEIELNNLKEKLVEVKSRLKKFEKNRESKSHIENQLKKLNFRLERFKKWNIILKKILEIENKLKTRNLEIKNYNKRFKEERDQCNKIKDEIRSKIKPSLEEYDEVLKSWRECLKKKKELEKRYEKISHLENQYQRIKELKDSKKELRHEIQLRNQEIKDLRNKVKEIETLKNNLENYDDKIEEYNEKREYFKNQLQNVKEKEKKYQSSKELKNQIREINNQIDKQKNRVEWIHDNIRNKKADLKPLEEKKKKLEGLRERREVFIDFNNTFFKILIFYVIGLISTIILSVIINPLMLIGTILIGIILTIHFLKHKGYFGSADANNFPQEWYSKLQKDLKEFRKEMENKRNIISVLEHKKEKIKNRLDRLNLVDSKGKLDRKKRAIENEIIKLEEQIRNIEEKKNENRSDLKFLIDNNIVNQFEKEKKSIKKLEEKKEEVNKKIVGIIVKNELSQYENEELKHKIENLRDAIKDNNRKIQQAAKNCRKIANGYSLSIHSQNFQDYVELRNTKFSDIEHMCFNEINWDNNEEVYKKLRKYRLFNYELEQLKTLMEKIKKSEKEKEEIKRTLKELEEKEVSFKEKIPKKYLEKTDLFESEFNQLREEKSRFKQKMEDLENYFNKITKNDLIKHKRELKDKILTKSKEIEDIDKIKEIKLKELDKIKENIPDQFLNGEQKEQEKNLKDEIKRFERKTSSLKSENKANWKNLKKNIGNLIKLEDINSLKNKELRKRLVDQREKYTNKLKNWEQILGNKFSELKYNFSLVRFKQKIDKMKNKIGGLKTEIKNARKANQEMKDHYRKSRIIKDVNINPINLESKFKNTVKERVVLDKTVEILDEA